MKCIPYRFLAPAFMILLLSKPCFAQDITNSPKKINSGQSEVQITASPYPRILSYQTREKASLLFTDALAIHSGIRLSALEEIDGQQTNFPFDQPAEWLGGGKTNQGLRALAGDKAKDLQLDMQLELVRDELRIQCTLTNTSKRVRTLALWGIAALPTQGWLATSFSRGLEDNRWVHARLISYWNSSPGEACVQLGKEGLALDLSKETLTASLKFGTRSNSGWVAAVRPDLSSMLTVLVPYSSSDRYPDENCNITLWIGHGAEQDSRSEMEWLSPWKTLAPGKNLHWSFILQNSVFNPVTPISPDGLVQAIRSPVLDQVKNPGPSENWHLDAASPCVRDIFNRITEWRNHAGVVIAKAPFWNNAPVRALDGQAMEWNESTIVEPEPAQIPPWLPTGRIWTMEFSLPKQPVKESKLLFQDGGITGGCAMILEDNHVSLLFWSPSIPLMRLTASLSAGQHQKVRASFEPEHGLLTLQCVTSVSKKVKGSTPIFLPEQRLVIGRNQKFPAEWNLPKIAPFAGQVNSLEIAPGSGP